MKKILIVDVPEEYEIQDYVVAFDFKRKIEDDMVINLETHIYDLPTNEDSFVDMCEYFSVDFEFAQSPDFYAGVESFKKRIGLFNDNTPPMEYFENGGK